MIFRQLFDKNTATFTYLLAEEDGSEAILIDTVKENLEEYMALLKQRNLMLTYVLDTHVHADHITCSGLLRERTGCQIAMGEKSEAESLDVLLKDGDALTFANQTLTTISTPGHTSCHTSYKVWDRVFTGDCLFINGSGRADFQGGSPEAQWDSVVGKLFELPGETLVYPGHDYKGMCVSSIAQEKNCNPNFKNATRESFVAREKGLTRPPPKKIKEAVPANLVCGIEK